MAVFRVTKPAAILGAGGLVHFVLTLTWQARFCCYCLGEIETCTVSPEWTA